MRSSLRNSMDINELTLIYMWQSEHALWSPLSILLSDGKCCNFFSFSQLFIS